MMMPVPARLQPGALHVLLNRGEVCCAADRLRPSGPAKSWAKACAMGLLPAAVVDDDT